MASSGLPASAQSHMAHQLLSRAHSPDTTAKLFTERVKNRPLFLRPTSPTPEDNRARRRLHRLRKKEYFLRKQKPQPFSAREKRKTGIHKLRKEEIKYDVFKGLHKMWVNYMHGVLGLNQDKKNQGKVTALSHGPMLASADFHGAELEVVRSRCVSRVGVKGIVVRDSKFSFVIVTEKNESKTIPKEHTVFRFQVPVDPLDESESASNLVFELHGSQFENRPADRANKKFKWRNIDYL